MVQREERQACVHVAVPLLWYELGIERISTLKTASQEYGYPADVFSFGVVLWELLTLEQPWYNDHERPGLCSKIMPEVHGMNQLFVIRQVPLGVRLPLPTAQDVEPALPDLPKVHTIPYTNSTTHVTCHYRLD